MRFIIQKNYLFGQLIFVKMGMKRPVLENGILAMMLGMVETGIIRLSGIEPVRVNENPRIIIIIHRYVSMVENMKKLVAIAPIVTRI